MAFYINNRPLNLSLGAIGLTLFCGGAALAADREWVSFDSSPPGTAPTIEVMPDRSSADLSVFEIRLHGMWIEEKPIPGTTESMQARFIAGRWCDGNQRARLARTSGRRHSYRKHEPSNRWREPKFRL